MISETSEEMRKIAVIATPTSPLLSPLLHALSHQHNLAITVLTRPTTLKIPFTSSHAHSHSHGPSAADDGHPPHHSVITHSQTSFSDEELGTNFRDVETVICLLTGPDMHLTPSLIASASTAGVQHFIPSEYGLDTSNAKVRELLPPYLLRWEMQGLLKTSGMRWTALYSGLVLEDALRVDGVLGIDVLWGSVAVFPGIGGSKVAVSTYGDIADVIVKVVMSEKEGGEEELWTCGFQVTLEEVVAVVEEAIGKKLDRYEGSFEGAKKEAAERMKRGYFDGGVSLMGRVAVWDGEVGAWGGWKGIQGGGGDWQEKVRRVVRMIRDGEDGGGGCGC